MTLNDIANIATIVEAVFVVISVYFIWRELRMNSKLTKAANNQSLVELSSPFNMQLIQDQVRWLNFGLMGKKICSTG